jgi:hypothetical protein
MLGIKGGSDLYANGQRFETVDPAQARSLGTKATVSYLKEALNTKASTFTVGGFTEEIPDDNNAAAKQVMQIALHGLINENKGKNRPIMDVTYANVAGGDEGKVGLNVKFKNYDYLKRYLGSDKNPGPVGNIGGIEPLMNEGVTIYMDKDKTNDLFTQGTRLTPLETVLLYDKKIDMTAHPDYTKNLNFEWDEMMGQYKVHGQVKFHDPESGKDVWKYKYFPISGAADVDNAVSQAQGIINEYLRQAMADDQSRRYNQAMRK